MPTYWVTLKDGRRGCVETNDDEDLDLVVRASLGTDVVTSWALPYPAQPRLRTTKWTDQDGDEQWCPSFCYSPEQCKGRTSCPRSRSCTS